MFHPSDPTSDEVNLDDIAISLAKQCRYNGHNKGFEIYSVAQHAVHVSEVVEELGGSTMEIFWGLHHDDAEAYTGDIVTQVKQANPSLRDYIIKIERVVAEATGLSWPEPPIVKYADLVMLATEKRDIMRPKAMWVPEEWGDMPAPREKRIAILTPKQAYDAYTKRDLEIYLRLIREKESV